MTPGVVELDELAVFSLVDQFDAERPPIMGLPLWYLMLSVGEPANHCLDAVLTLQAAYRTFGIEAVPAPAELFVDDGRGGPTGYGDPHPRFEDGYLVGHAGLWLPESRRFIDPTVQQFPEIRGTNPIPVFVPFPEDWHHLVGQPLHAVCAETILTYLPPARTRPSHWPFGRGRVDRCRRAPPRCQQPGHQFPRSHSPH
jgi:hypothetical protein